METPVVTHVICPECNQATELGEFCSACGARLRGLPAMANHLTDCPECGRAVPRPPNANWCDQCAAPLA